MLPRARTAAPGSLSDDPVVPLLPRSRIVGLAFGDAQSLRRGGHGDPVGSRPYRPGDDLRTIDRHATARLSSTSDDDQLIVREHLAEERLGVGLAIDPSPTMSLQAPELPWLHKPAVAVELGRVVEASARRKRLPLVRLATLPPDGAVPSLGAGSIVFLVSDFLAFPPEEAWADAAVRGWDAVPVVVQDRIWEQSFPDVAGVSIPLADVSGAIRPVRLTAAEVRARREANEERYAGILSALEDLGLEPVAIDSADPERVFEALLLWAEGRRNGARWTG